MAASTDFDERFPVLAPIAYRVAYRLLGQREDAENVTQETLARAYSHWSRISRYDEAWVTRVATNLSLGHLRKERPTRSDRAPVADTDVEVTTRVDVADALKRLPRRQRQVIVLRFLADMSERDTAVALGCSAGSVKRHVHRGLHALRGALGVEVPAGRTYELPLDSHLEERC